MLSVTRSRFHGSNENRPRGILVSCRLPGLRTIRNLYAYVVCPAELLATPARRFGDVFRINLPLGPKLTYFLTYQGHRQVTTLRPDVAGIGGVLAQAPVFDRWFRRSGKDENSLEALAVETRRILAQLVSSRSSLWSEIDDTVYTVTRSRSVAWPGTIDLSTDLHPLIYESAMRLMLGEELWTALGRKMVDPLHTTVGVTDLPRIMLSRTLLRFAMPEYRAAKGLERVLDSAFQDPFLTISPAVREIVRAQRSTDGIEEADRTWILMFLLWNAVTYTGSYGIWTLADILSHREVLEEVESAVGAERIEVISRCLWETIRRHPLAAITRKLKQPVTCPANGQSYQISAGRYVGVAVTALTRDGTRFPDPDAYCPRRYIDTPPPLDLLYGQGPFGCVAREFSRVLIAGTLATLFDLYELRLTVPVPERINRLNIAYPSKPIHATARPRPTTS
jgi:cytochrome P450